MPNFGQFVRIWRTVFQFIFNPSLGQISKYNFSYIQDSILTNESYYAVVIHCVITSSFDKHHHTDAENCVFEESKLNISCWVMPKTSHKEPPSPLVNILRLHHQLHAEVTRTAQSHYKSL